MPNTSAFKCPGCAAPLAWDLHSQTLHCDHCHNSFAIEVVKEYNEGLDGSVKMDWRKVSSTMPLEGMVSYTCESCGAVVETDATTGSTTCPYCGNNVILTPNMTEVLRPDYVIPFKVELGDAKKKLRDFTKGMLFLPSKFLDRTRINKIVGRYVPFWLYDCSVDARVDYRCTTVRVWSEGDYDCTETTYWLARRAGSADFQRIPVDASQAMDDKLMDALEPFNYGALVPYDPGYLAGYQADRYDVDVDTTTPRVNKRVQQSVTDVLSRSLSRYSSVQVEGADIRSTKGTVSYALLPVWTLSTEYRGKKYLYVMNGQTGRIVGTVPWSKPKFWSFVIGLSVVLTAVATFVTTYLV